jgi:hypothetical protein
MLDWDFWLKTKTIFGNHENSTIKRYKIGTSIFKITFLGLPNVDQFTKALDHLEALDNLDIFDFSIFVSDYSNGNIMLPTPSWSWDDDVDQHGFINSIDPKHLIGRFMGWQNTFSLINLKENSAIYWTKNIADLPEWERSFPFRDIFHSYWALEQKLIIVHAAAVGTSKGGILMTGKGGSGKSTAALSCLESKMLYAGDDLVLVDIENKKIFSLYNVAKLEESQLDMFPNFRDFIYNPEALPKEKAQLFLYDFFISSLIIEMPLKGIAVMKFSGTATSKYDLSTPSEGLKALAPSTIGLLKESPKHINIIAELCKRVPVYSFSTGTNLTEIPLLLEELLTILND